MNIKIFNESSLKILEREINLFIKDKKYAQVSFSMKDTEKHYMVEYIGVIIYEP